MGIKLKARTTGFKSLHKEVTREALNETFAVCNAAGKKAKAQAQANAPVDTGFHRSNIIRRTVRRKSSVFVVIQGNAPYAPYLEFGTGDSAHVRIPDGYEEYASQFRGSGGRIQNMMARPHIIPAIQGAANDIENELEKRLSKI